MRNSLHLFFKYYYMLLSFMLLANFGFGQTKEVDSLKSVLTKSQINDSSEVNAYIALTKAYMQVNIDSTYKFSKIALQKALSTNNHSIVKAYGNRGTALDLKSQSDSARFFYDKALVELDKEDNKIERSAIYTNYSLTYQNSDRMDLALDYNSKAIDLVKDNDKEVCRLYFNRAILYLRSNIPESGKKYLMLAYESSKKVNDLRVEGAATQTLGYYYIEEKKLDSARIYLEKGLDLCERTKSPETCFRVNSTLGDLYIAMNLASEAHEAILNAKKYAELRNKTDDILLTLIQLGELEYNRDDYEKSKQYFEEFEKLYELKNQENPGLLSDAYNLWSGTEFKRGNYKKSAELLNLHIDIFDSITTTKNKELLADADVKYETAKKDKEIAEQQLELVDQQLSIQESESKTQILSLFIVSLLLGSILLWFSFRQRQKRMQQQLVAIEREQEVRTLESLMEGEEKERLRIAKELHDGVNGDLAAIKFKLTSLLETNNQVINEAVAMIDKSSEQVRAISHNLVPPSLRDFNVLEAVATYCENMNAIHAPEISFQHVGEDIVLEKKQEANLFRIVQELVTNSIKHAMAKEIMVQLSNVEDNLQLTVEDDGKGFDVANIKSEGIGMQNVKSRVDYLGGLMDIKSDAKGTSFTITLTDKSEKA